MIIFDVNILNIVLEVYLYDILVISKQQNCHMLNSYVDMSSVRLFGQHLN
jgi:hypothetical protein